MSEKEKMIITAEYKKWLGEVKQNFQNSQIKASVQVNSALLEFYWSLGGQIVEKQKSSKWGSGFLQQLSDDLGSEFPEVKGFSVRNLKHIRQWFVFWKQAVSPFEDKKRKQVVSQMGTERADERRGST